VALDLALTRPGGADSEPALQVEVRDRLERAFAGMSLQHRAVLALRFTLDLPMRDIALSLGVPEGTARSRLNAAVTRLRAALDEDTP
jgi:RNA polymerase sigma factor (sigma-70 family)